MPCALRATINEEDCLNSSALREAKKWLISALRLRWRIAGDTTFSPQLEIVSFFGF
jgi:hypothetical protein